jgi:putative MATE family efflux protein|nr:MATE family efflux transporter [Candidatus Krumholzibacteria bacterium]
MEPSAPSRTNRLTTAPIPGLIRELAIPASMGLFFNTMYNVVDTFYAGRWSTEALAALSLSFPVFFSFLALGSGFSTGATALIGNALGRDDRGEAACTSSQGLVLSLFLTAFVMTTGFLAAPSLFRLLGADGQYLEICLEYMNIILLGCGFVFVFYQLNGILNSTGDTRSFRDYLLVATLANIVLDPWFMYGGLGVPSMGVGGIALATIMAQSGGMVFLGIRARRTGLLWRSTGARWRPHWPTLRAIMGQGIPASLNMMTVAIGVFIITYFLSRFGQPVVAAYGVATRIEQIVLLPALGLNIAVLTLAAQNSGAGRFDRVRQTVRKALQYGGVIMVFGTALIFFGARPLMDFFTDDAEVIAIGTHYLRIAAFIEYAYVLLFVNTSVLQGLKKPMFALWIGAYRQLAAPFLVFTLAERVLGWGIDGIWWGVFGITWSAAAIAVVYAMRMVDKMAKDNPQPLAQEA